MTDSDCVKTWFSKRKLGMFIHFGLYSIDGWHEQDQMRRKIPRKTYEKLSQRFNPVNFNPDAILDLAEQAGMEYICLTTKHHDGFCLWDTKQTEFTIMNSPYSKDLLKELADACHKRNFPLGIYYSVVDWHHPNYPNQGRHHELAEPEEGDVPDLPKYMDYLKAQVKELCSNYGEIRHFFWDMNVPEHKDPSINNMLRSLQPNIVINDRGCDQGDFGTPEREYDKSKTDRHTQFNRPTEACNSVGTQSWGYRENENYYSHTFLMQSIDNMMSKGANYLLNVGPDSKGNIPEVACDMLIKIGEWYNKVRNSFADTQPCTELTTNQDVLLTKKDKILYVHLIPPVKSDAVILAPLSTIPHKATILNTGKELECSKDILPMYWQNREHVLRIKGLPRDLITGCEPLIIKLQFDEQLPMPLKKAKEFQG